MKKIILLISVLFLFSNSSLAKRHWIKEYKASNGINYKIGDTIKLGNGSGENGKFIFVKMGGWMMSTQTDANMLSASNAGLLVTIKKIIKINSKHIKRVDFIVGAGNITNYVIDIENALRTGEIDYNKNH